MVKLSSGVNTSTQNRFLHYLCFIIIHKIFTVTLSYYLHVDCLFKITIYTICNPLVMFSTCSFALRRSAAIDVLLKSGVAFGGEWVWATGGGRFGSVAIGDVR